MKEFNFSDYTKSLKLEPKSKGLNTKKLRQSILIVCEGEKTEPLYFESFKKRLPKEILKQVVIAGKGMNTVSLVQEAIKENEEKLKNDGKKYDQTWIVMDRDSFTIKNINDAHQKAKVNKYHMAYSDECFELWYLLHFIFLDTQISRKAYVKKLNTILKDKKLSSYNKSSKEMYFILKEFGDQKLAIKYAKKLENSHKGKTLINKKPSTSVYKLVNLLNNYLFD